MKPTEEPVIEHHAIQRMLGILEEMVSRLEAGRAVDTGDLEASADFIRGFAVARTGRPVVQCGYG